MRLIAALSLLSLERLSRARANSFRLDSDRVLRLGRGKVIVDGKEIPAKVLGSGLFTKAVFADDAVLLFPQYEQDFARTAMYELQRDTRSPYFPQMWSAGWTPDDLLVYSMPLYENLPRTGRERAWVRELSAAASRAHPKVRVRGPHDVHRLSWAILEEVSGKIPRGLWRRLEEALRYAGNYGESVGLDLAPQNFSVTGPKGRQLVLRDVFADYEAAQRIRLGNIQRAMGVVRRRGGPL